MFLEATWKRNSKLIEASIDFHHQGYISPNTYVVDLDTVKQNATILAREAKKQDIELFFMTKQLGRNPLVAKTIVEAGIEKAVAVDPWEAITLYNHGIPIGHVGHLVQIPKCMVHSILTLHPDYITVFSYENARIISDIALEVGRRQKVFLRIAALYNFIYDGQKGGFTNQQLLREIDELIQLEGIEIAGLTSFPCLLIKEDEVEPTPNVQSMLKAKELLKRKGFSDIEMNMPSATSTDTLPLLKELGATQGEPGHAFTGSTPLHAAKDLPECPAMVYVSEVSHVYDRHSYVFGGGFYPRSRVEHALLGTNINNVKEVEAIENNPSNIDYYGTLNTNKARVGDTVIYAFRTQAFVTNAQLAIVKNLNSKPELIGIYDAMGNQIR